MALDVRIEGMSVEEILALPEAELDVLVFTGTPLVFKAGTAEVLGRFEVDGQRLVAELAHVDGGGEGVLPSITSVLQAIAKRRQLREIDWIVYATNCAKPNPKLRRVLERRGFVIDHHVQKGECYRNIERTDGSGA